MAFSHACKSGKRFIMDGKAQNQVIKLETVTQSYHIYILRGFPSAGKYKKLFKYKNVINRKMRNSILHAYIHMRK